MKDEIDEFIEWCFEEEESYIHDQYDGTQFLQEYLQFANERKAEAKQAILTLKKKWETESYKKGYIQAGIDNLTNGDK